MPAPTKESGKLAAPPDAAGWDWTAGRARVFWKGSRKGLSDMRINIQTALVSALVVVPLSLAVAFSPGDSSRPDDARAESEALAAAAVAAEPVIAKPPAGAAESAAEPRVDYDRDIRPILSENCFACHGPDAAARKAELRLDLREGAVADRDGRAAVVPGDPAASLLLRRVREEDADRRMPPAETEKRLSAEQIELLERWIAGGAEYQTHWAFRPVQRPEPPAVRDSGWVRNEVDRFILARLEQEGLRPSEEADRRTLIRRLSFDLTGLPPAPQQVAEFVSDERPDAYARLVDRLLADPHHGERMAMEWLDAARYGDTNGYHIDNERYMWRWRDWVIEAFNRNMPFDQFTIEQLAGDLLPEPTLSQRIATGFHRNHMINFEGGAIPEEYQVEYVLDRVTTTGTVWLGLTVGCARCHDHKYDPISQEEFYQLYAFFNTVPEEGLDGKTGNAVPLIEAPLPEQEGKLAELAKSLEQVEQEMYGPAPELDEKQAAWEAELFGELSQRWRVIEPFSAAATSGATLTRQADGSYLAGGRLADTDVYEFVVLTQARGFVGFRVEALTDASLPLAGDERGGGPGRSENGNFVLTEFEVEAAPLADAAAAEPVKFATAHADHSQPTFHVTAAVDGDAKTGWAVLREGMTGEDRVAVFVPQRPVGFEGGTALKIRLRHESVYKQHSIGRVRVSLCTSESQRPHLAASKKSTWHMVGPFKAVTAAEAHDTPFGPEQALASGVDLSASYGEESLKWVEQPEFVDGKPHALPTAGVTATYLCRTITAPTARPMRVSLGSDDSVKVWLNGELVHENRAARPVAPDQDFVRLNLKAGVNTLLLKVVNHGGEYAFYFDPRDDHSIDPPLAMQRVLERPAQERSEAQQRLVRGYFRERHMPQWAELAERRRRVSGELAELRKAIPSVMVMAEMPEPRKTYFLKKGQYDQLGPEVRPGVPAVLPPLPEGEANRLALARWLVDPGHPLTARVAVNRLWQMVFGAGLVRTSEDFGAQGEWPSHPELLDWLAAEYVSSGWDTRHILRLMVHSATYRQVSRVTPELRQRDPENRLLARAPRLRLSAEMVRDNALAVSGLLVDRIGGPSVRPYQPPGLWEEVAIDPTGATWTAQVYKQDHGEALYRRSLYTFRKRSVPPPAMAIFDAPSREFCVVRRPRTNTPLQALVLMNDPTYVEAARKLAERLMREAGDSAHDRLALAFELALARPPEETESAALRAVLDEQLAWYAENKDAAQALLGVGESARDESLDEVELAAWATVASVILNLDETITRS